MTQDLRQWLRSPRNCAILAIAAGWPLLAACSSAASGALLHFGITTPLALLAATLAGRSFLRGGDGPRLWQGCGVLAWSACAPVAAIGSAIAPNPLPGALDFLSWLSAFCHFGGAFVGGGTVGGRSRRRRLALAYGAVLAAALALVLAPLHDGQAFETLAEDGGENKVRQALATAALLMLSATAIHCLAGTWNPIFRRRYGAGLLLIATAPALALAGPDGLGLAAPAACVAQLLGAACMLAAFGSDPALRGPAPLAEEVTALSPPGNLKHYLAEIAEYTSEGVMVFDRHTRILAVNRAFSEITGFRPEEILGRSPRILRARRQAPRAYRQLWCRLQEHGSWRGELWNRRKNGETYLERLTVDSIRDSSGVAIRYIAIFGDITESRRQDAQIRELAYRDILTGLSNRLLLEDRLRHGLAMAKREGRRLGVLLIDLDRFKQVNDHLGHDIGDRLLQEVARRLQEAVRSSDTIARLGGDEFVVVMENLRGTDACATVAGKIATALRKKFEMLDGSIEVGASIGIAICPEDGEDAATLMKKADTAMYEAKASGRGGYRFFWPAMAEASAERRKLTMALRHAIEHDEFLVHYQPKICGRTGALRGLEALVRWRHADGRSVPAGEFIPIAEETSIIGDIGDYVLNEVCRQLSDWRIRGLDPVKVAVNASARQLGHGQLLMQVRRATRKFALTDSLLELELTESSVMDNAEQAAIQFAELKAGGITLAIDDFGTGHSSLSRLHRLPVDVLKIDRSFVVGADHDEEGRKIVRMIMTLGKALGLTIVAEGIETESQAAFLRELGCDILQGFLFSVPLPAEEVERLWLLPAAAALH